MPQDPQTYKDRISNIARQANELARQEIFTARDLARAVELNQQYYDVLRELEESDLTIDESVTVRAEGKTIKFKSIEDVSEWITSL